MNSKKAVELYHNLCDNIQTVNSIFSFPLVFVIFYLFVFDMFSSYNFIAIFKEGLEDPLVFFTDSVTIVFNFVVQAILFHSSSSTTEEFKETSIIISKIINCDNCKKTDKKIFKTFLIQNQYRNLKLETIFFTINWELLAKVSEI